MQYLPGANELKYLVSPPVKFLRAMQIKYHMVLCKQNSQSMYAGKCSVVNSLRPRDAYMRR